MGIQVSENKEVTYDPEGHRLVSTCTAANPTHTRKKGLLIRHVYKRVRAQSHSGDGNPLIYALKRKGNYTIAHAEVRKFYPSLWSIATAIVQLLPQDRPCLFAPMPSGHRIARRLARLLHRLTPGSTLSNTMFRKATNQDVLQQLMPHLATPKYQKMHAFKQLLSMLGNDPDGTIGLKDVDMKVRPLVSPVQLRPEMNGVRHDGVVVLVDDLMASGVTLLSARDGLISGQVVSQSGDVLAVTLFSSLV